MIATQGQVILRAKYKESPENGLIDQSFEAEVKNVLPGIEVFFSVNDTFGAARFSLDRFGLPDDGTGRVDGPRGETGDMVRAYRGTSSIEAPLVLRP